MQKEYSFTAILHESPDKGGAYIIFPYDIRREFGKGRVRVHAEFNGFPYDASIVNMGVKDQDLLHHWRPEIHPETVRQKGW